MIAFIALLAFELARNWYVIAKLKQTPNHARGWALRVLVILFVSFFKFDLESQDVVIFGRFFSGIPVTTILYCLGCGMAFWFPFDVLLNVSRGKVWNHTGTVAKLDRFKSDAWWIVKAVLMCAGIWLIW
jgi:hypothetical protein